MSLFDKHKSRLRFNREFHTKDRASKWDDLKELAALEARAWKPRMNELYVNGVPTALTGGFAGLEATPQPANYAAVTGGATELAIWSLTATPIGAPIINNPICPKAYYVCAFGQQTTAATPGTFTLNPRIGNAITSPSVGISTAITPVASETTTNWCIKGDLIIRNPGTAAVPVGTFLYYQSSNTTTSGTISTATTNVFGGVGATFDATGATNANQLLFGMVVTTSTTNTITTQGLIFGSWN